MNLLIVETDELDSNKQLRLSGRRLKHLNEILKLQAGDKLRVGQLGGQIGVGLVRTIDTQVAVIDVSLEQEPPAPLPLSVVLALPRPKMLRRILRGLAET
ncbi:16S rRNA (uracil(1498)-N(3))-methyltransferase, partial [Congregibacter sp.]